MPLVVRVVVDILSFVLAFLPCILLEFFFSPYRRGFFCNDETIKYPFKDDTVTGTALVVTAILLPFVLFLLIEGWPLYKDTTSRSSPSMPSPFSMFKRFFPWQAFVKSVYAVFGVFLFGLAVVQTLTDIGKFSSGRLRPHFFAVCQPDLTLLNCTASDGAPLVSKYVTIDDKACRQHDAYNLRNARMSFPSGHSSMSAYVAVFLALYLQMRLTWSGSRLVRHLLQALVIYLSVFVCLSRVSDYKHHPEDVFFGAFIGILVASLTSIHIYNKMLKHSQVTLANQNLELSATGSSATLVDPSGTQILFEDI